MASITTSVELTSEEITALADAIQGRTGSRELERCRLSLDHKLASAAAEIEKARP